MAAAFKWRWVRLFVHGILALSVLWEIVFAKHTVVFNELCLPFLRKMIDCLLRVRSMKVHVPNWLPG